MHVSEILSARNDGYMARGKVMLEQKNYQGVIDQLERITTENLPLTDSESEEMAFMLGTAYYHTANPRCQEILNGYLRNWPASSRVAQTRIMLGDYYFFAHDFSEALEYYNLVSSNSLNAGSASTYNYRRALSMVKCGLYDQALPIFRSLANDREYDRVAKFYEAYIDYVKGDTDVAYDKFMALTGNNRIVGNGSKTKTTSRKRFDYESDGIEPGYYICQILLQRGNWEECATTGMRLIERRPVTELLSDTRRAIGLSLLHLEDYSRAESYLEDYVTTSEKNASADARYGLGVCRYERGDLNGAREMFLQLTDLHDAIAQGSYLYLGQIAASENNADSAVMNFEKAYRMNYDPDVSETALYNYIAARTRGGNVPFDTSVDLLREFLTKYPDSQYTPEVDLALASSYYSQGDYEKALGFIRKVSRNDEKRQSLYQQILYACGSAAVTKGDIPRGESLLEECVSIKGGSAEVTVQALIWLGDALYAQDKYARAEKCYQSAISSNETGASKAMTLYNLAYSQLMQNKFTHARGNFSELVRNPGNLPSDIIADARMRLADCKYYTGDYKGAAADFSEFSKDPRFADYSLLRNAEIAGIQGETRKKITILENLIDKHPDSRWLYQAMKELGETYTAEGMHSRASILYEKMSNLYPTGEKGEAVASALIDSYIDMMRTAEKYAEQIEYARKVKSYGGLDAEIIEEASFIEAKAILSSGKRSEKENAISGLHRLRENAQSLWGAKSAVTLGQYLLDSGNPEGCITLMEEFTTSGTPHTYWLARGFILLADATEKTGKEYMALEYLRSLQQNYPGDEPDIHDMIARRINKLEKK